MTQTYPAVDGGLVLGNYRGSFEIWPDRRGMI
jgi:hypothetical protein